MRTQLNYISVDTRTIIHWTLNLFKNCLVISSFPSTWLLLVVFFGHFHNISKLEYFFCLPKEKYLSTMISGKNLVKMSTNEISNAKVCPKIAENCENS